MNQEQFMQVMAMQNELMAKQNEFFKATIARLAPQQRGEVDQPLGRAKWTMDTLAKSMSEFHYDPDNELIFQSWYARYSDLFDIDANHLDDAAKTRLLIRKLSTIAHTRFLNYILPKKPREMTFEETKSTLEKIFGRQTSLFNLRFNCLKVTKNETTILLHTLVSLIDYAKILISMS